MLILGLLGLGFFNENSSCMTPAREEYVAQQSKARFDISGSAAYLQNSNEFESLTELQGISGRTSLKLQSICVLNCSLNGEGTSEFVQIMYQHASGLQLINCAQTVMTEDKMLLFLQACLDIMANGRILKVVALPINCPPQFKPIFMEISKEILNWQFCTYKKQCPVLTGGDKISALCSKAYGEILQLKKERLSKIDQEIESSKTEQKKLEEINQQKKKALDELNSCIEEKKEAEMDSIVDQAIDAFKIEELKTELAKLEEANQQKKKELDELISCIEGKKEELDELNSLIEGKKEELDELDRRIERKKEEAEEQASSTEQEKTEAEAKAMDDQINEYNQYARLSAVGLY